MNHRPKDATGNEDFSRRVRYLYIEYMIQHLSDCSREFDGDLQQMLVMAIIGQSYMHSVLNVHAREKGDLSELPRKSIVSTSSIAEITGIPRQTVRRKLLLLHGKGYIEPVSKGHWRLVVRGDVPSARIAYAEIDQRSIQRTIGLYRALDRLMRSEEEQIDQSGHASR